tara:strand:- start:150 stop:887 length:738 start_codon:yes stop_codon:yes gene_type:complete
MPNHCEDIGPGWTTDANGQCVYSPPALDTGAEPSGGFTGTVDSLGYEEDLKYSTLEDPEEYAKYFDPYSTEEEERLATTAETDIGQLGTAWDLSEKQLGEVWGSKRSGLGREAGLGLREVKRTGISAKREAGMAYSGTAEEYQRRAESDVMEQYETGIETGKSAYEQALEVGKLGLEQATTDIYQGLDTATTDLRKEWKDESRDTLNILLGRDIWYDPKTEYLKDGEITKKKKRKKKKKAWWRYL